MQPTPTAPRLTAMDALRLALSTPLVARLVAFTGMGLIIAGYLTIYGVDSLSPAIPMQGVTRQALGGMMMLTCGGLLEIALVVTRR